MAKINYGGQALIEGVMMNGPQGYALAARTAAGDIIYKQVSRQNTGKKTGILKLPIFRGLVSFFSSLKIGMSALTWSASFSEEEEEQLGTKEIVLATVLAFVFTVVIFIVVPVLIGSWLLPYVGFFGRSLVEGILKVGFFLVYLILIARQPDIARVFAYHGAEHKTISALEAGEHLTSENTKKYSTIHPRCGTSFIMMVMILTIFIFTFVGNTTVLNRIIIKIVLLPVIMGISYELFRLPLKFPNSRLVKALVAPGLAMQKLTTREPDAAMLEVAITALMMTPGFPQGDNVLPPRVYAEGEAPPTGRTEKEEANPNAG